MIYCCHSIQTFFSLFSPVTNLMIVPTRVLKKVMRSLLKRSQRYSIFMLALPLNILFHLLTVLLLLQSLPLRFQRKKAAVMKIVKRKVTNRLKLPTKNWHRMKYFYNLNCSIFWLFHIRWVFDKCIISCRPKLLPKAKVSLLDQRRFLWGIYPIV